MIHDVEALLLARTRRSEGDLQDFPETLLAGDSHIAVEFVAEGRVVTLLQHFPLHRAVTLHQAEAESKGDWILLVGGAGHLLGRSERIETEHVIERRKSIIRVVRHL